MFLDNMVRRFTKKLISRQRESLGQLFSKKCIQFDFPAAEFSSSCRSAEQYLHNIQQPLGKNPPLINKKEELKTACYNLLFICVACIQLHKRVIDIGAIESCSFDTLLHIIFSYLPRSPSMRIRRKRNHLMMFYFNHCNRRTLQCLHTGM